MADVDIGTLLARLKADTQQFSREMAEARQAVKTTSEEIRRSSTEARGAAKSHDDLTSSIAKVVTISYACHEVLRLEAQAFQEVTGAIKNAVSAAVEFEDQFADVRKAVDGDSASMKSLADDIRHLSTEMPITTKELNAIATAGGQLGVSSENIKEFTSVVAELGKASTLGPDKAATFIGQFSNITKLDASEFRNLASAIAELDRSGASTADQISDIALRVAGAGQVLGVGRADILGWSAAIANAGINSEAGGSAISRMFERLKADSATGGQALRAWADVAGMSLEDFSNLVQTDGSAAAAKFVEGVARMNDEGGNVIGTLKGMHIEDIREIDAILRLGQAYHSVTDTVAQSNAAWKDVDALHRIAQERFNTTAAKLEMLQSAIMGGEAVATSPIAEAVGALADAAKDAIVQDDALYKSIATDLTPSITNLSREMKPLIEDFAHTLPEAIRGTLTVLIEVGEKIAAITKLVQDLDHGLQGIGGIQGQVGGIARGMAGAIPVVGPIVGAVADVHGVEEAVQRQRAQQAAAAAAADAAAQSFDAGNFPLLRQLQDGADDVEEIAEKTEELNKQVLRSLDVFHQVQTEVAHATALGREGQRIMAALPAAMADPNLSQNVTKMLNEVERLKDALGKELHPEQAAAVIARMMELVKLALAEGTEETKQAVDDYLVVINRIRTVERPEEKEREKEAERDRKDAEREAERARKAAEAEAHRAAEAERKEAERRIEQHRQLVAEYQRAVADGESAIASGLGKEATTVNRALSDVFKEGAAGSQGAALGKAVEDLIKRARDVGVPEAEELGTALREAMLRTLASKSEDDRIAAQALVENISEQIAAQSRLTPENFARVSATAQQRASLGSEGGSLLDAITKSAKEGTPEALKAVGDAYESLRRKILGDPNLTPDQAAGYWGDIWAAIQRAIEEGGEDAIADLRDVMLRIGRELPLVEAREQAAERINVAIQNTAEQIRLAYEHGEEQMTDAQNQLTDAIRLRGMRENIKEVQEEELRPFTESIETARRNLRYFREDQNTERGRRRADFTEERDYQRQLDDLQEKRKKVAASASFGNFGIGGQDRLAQAAAEGIRTGPVTDPLYELHKQEAEMAKQHKRKLDDIKEQRAYEDEVTQTRRAEAETDATQEKVWAKSVADFKKDQAKNVQKFEDDLAREQLEWRLGPNGPVQREVNQRVDKLNEALAGLQAKEDQNIGKLEGRLALLYGETLPGIQEIAQDMLETPAGHAREMAEYIGSVLSDARTLQAMGIILPGVGAPIGIPEPVVTDGVTGRRVSRAEKGEGNGTNVTVSISNSIVAGGADEVVGGIVDEVLDRSERSTALGGQ